MLHVDFLFFYCRRSRNELANFDQSMALVYFVVIAEDFFSSLKFGTLIFFHLRFCNSSIILSAFTGNNLIHLKQCCLVAEFTFFLLF